MFGVKDDLDEPQAYRFHVSRMPALTLDPELYALYMILNGAPCTVEVTVKTGHFSKESPGHIRILRDAPMTEPFDPFAKGELLGEATWTGIALTERSGTLTEQGFDEVEIRIKTDVQARLRAKLGTPRDDSRN